jgi:hypothetical protein
MVRITAGRAEGLDGWVVTRSQKPSASRVLALHAVACRKKRGRGRGVKMACTITRTGHGAHEVETLQLGMP